MVAVNFDSSISARGSHINASLAARWKLVSASQRLSHGRVEFMQVIKTFDDILKVVELAGASS